MCIIHFVKKVKLKYFLSLTGITVLLLINLYTTLCCTILRGHENPWNGQIFNPKSAYEIEQEKKNN